MKRKLGGALRAVKEWIDDWKRTVKYKGDRSDLIEPRSGFSSPGKLKPTSSFFTTDRFFSEHGNRPIIFLFFFYYFIM